MKQFFVLSNNRWQNDATLMYYHGRDKPIFTAPTYFLPLIIITHFEITENLHASKIQFDNLLNTIQNLFQSIFVIFHHLCLPNQLYFIIQFRFINRAFVLNIAQANTINICWQFYQARKIIVSCYIIVVDVVSWCGPITRQSSLHFFVIHVVYVRLWCQRCFSKVCFAFESAVFGAQHNARWRIAALIDCLSMWSILCSTYLWKRFETKSSSIQSGLSRKISMLQK